MSNSAFKCQSKLTSEVPVLVCVNLIQAPRDFTSEDCYWHEIIFVSLKKKTTITDVLMVVVSPFLICARAAVRAQAR